MKIRRTRFLIINYNRINWLFKKKKINDRIRIFIKITIYNWNPDYDFSSYTNDS